MQKVGVVVLNYKNYNETVRCVDSLLKQEDVELRISIVDNGSHNESIKVLSEKYERNTEVELISSEANLGFAKGMNLGIDLLRKEGYDNIFVANSDLILTTPRILAQMIDAYENCSEGKRIGVVNPTMNNVDGTLAPRIQFRMNWLRLRMLKTYFPIIEKMRKPFKDAKNRKRPEGVSVGESHCTSGASKLNKYKLVDCSKWYVIVGSGYLLTDKFFDYYNGLFPDTFLYYEEYALMLYLQAVDLITMMVDTDKIIHGHGKSTPSKVKTNSGRMLLKLIFSSKKSIVKRYGIKEQAFN